MASERKLNAIENENEYGHVIQCVYDDELFKKCVSSEHKKQILHPVAVMGYNHSLYVVSISGNEFLSDRSRIVQSVITYISSEIK